MMLTRVIEVPNEPMAWTPLASRARRVEFSDAVIRPMHRARDSVDLADPLFHSVARAERAQIKALATPEQNLAMTMLRMRLVDASKR